MGICHNKKTILGRGGGDILMLAKSMPLTNVLVVDILT